MVHTPLRLFLFAADLSTALEAEAADVDSIIVDWETAGKQTRQQGYDTEINDHSVAAVASLSDRLTIPVTVRIDPLHAGTSTNIQRALDGGASILMLPMATTPREVNTFVDLVGGRAHTLIQIETQALVEHCEALQAISWDYVHVGLNDLKISRGDPWLWTPLLDGTIEQICDTLKGRIVGFGGATIIGGGDPIPFLGLLQEMARLEVGMALLRRSFRREVTGRNWADEIRALRTIWKALNRREPKAIRHDHEALQETLRQFDPSSPNLPAASVDVAQG